MSDNPFTLSTEDFSQLAEANSSEGFDDLVMGGSEAAQALKDSLQSSSFGSLDVSDFSDFSVQDYTPTEGVYHFACEQKWLREGTSVVRLISTVSNRGQTAFGGLKVTLYKGKLRLSTFNQSAFCEIFIPLFETLGDLEKEVSFIFDQGVLSKIASSFGDAIIEFTFHAAKSLLEIKSGNTHLELSTFNPEDFVDYHSKLNQPKLVSSITPSAVKEALSYTAQFVRKDEVSGNLSLVDVRQGYMVGGTYANVGIYQSEALKDLSFKVKFEALSVMEKLLSKFHETNTHLFDVGDYYMLRDENLYLGFEKSQFEFPPIDPFLTAKKTESVLVQRSDLVNSLQKLSVVSIDREMLVQIEVDGLGNDCTFILTTQDSSGRKSTDRIQARRTPENGQAPESLKRQSVYVNLHTLLKVAQHFETANINLKFEESQRTLFVEDGEEGRFNATTVMVVISESQFAQMQEERNQSVLDKAKSAGKKKKSGKVDTEGQEAEEVETEDAEAV